MASPSHAYQFSFDEGGLISFSRINHTGFTPKTGNQPPQADYP